MAISATPAALKDPYQFHEEDISDPPTSLVQIMRRIGPGIILAASIVGSGELIATTTLGAQVGYSALWVILVSCIIKPAVQAELGRYTIASGETGLEGLNRVPGPRWKVNWIVIGWAVMVLITLLQVGAMFGGVAQVMNQVVPAIPANLWVLILLAITLALLLGGGYQRIESLATVKVGLFTMLTFLCALLLMRQSQYFSWRHLAEGLQFHLPSSGLSTAVAVFGITGVGATELFMYPYWCVEKGYARFAGRRNSSPEWCYALRHLFFHGDIHDCHHRLLSARRRHSARNGFGAGCQGHDSGSLKYLYPDPGTVGPLAVLRRRHRYPLRDHFRCHGS
ncbi:MAG: hypothetical protein DMG06_20785 [Acidobacteria bacterium]|nr:MAG: hypothetical protein DMG06_20785 [Acidobacteriota bacterium]